MTASGGSDAGAFSGRPAIPLPHNLIDNSMFSRDANDVVRHVIGELRYLQSVCPDAIITVENPATGELKNYKPWKAACRELGLEAFDVTYCHFGAPHRKPTTIWTMRMRCVFKCADGGRGARAGAGVCGGVHQNAAGAARARV